MSIGARQYQVTDTIADGCDSALRAPLLIESHVHV
jgi:hypothetical protein